MKKPSDGAKWGANRRRTAKCNFFGVDKGDAKDNQIILLEAEQFTP